MTASNTPMAGSDVGQGASSPFIRHTSPEALALKVIPSFGGSPRQFSVETTVPLNDFDNEYVCFSGFYGAHGPHVFAAAPELLEALKEADRALRFYEWYANPKSNWAAPGSEHIRALVENAIAKATAKPIDTLPLGEGA